MDEPCCDPATFEAWRRNAPLTYDWICSSFLEWGALSAEFLGEREVSRAAMLRVEASSSRPKLQALGALLGRQGAGEADMVRKGGFARGIAFASRTGTSSAVVVACGRLMRSADGTFRDGAWQGLPCMLTVCDCVVQLPNTTPAASLRRLNHNAVSSRLIARKKIVHPGEVNRIRYVPMVPGRGSAC
jgi:hypothetical protein